MSGHKYITYSKRGKAHWRVVITRPGKRTLYLGSYYDLADALYARNDYCGVHDLSIEKGSRNKQQGMFD